MVSYSGKDAFVLVGIESTFNTPVSTTKGIGLIQNISIEENNNITNAYSIGDRQAQQSVAGTYDATINISSYWQQGTLMELMFGQCTDDSADTPDIKHVYVDEGTLEVANTTSPFTLSVNFDHTSDIVFTYGGCKVKSVTFTLDTGGILMMDASILASSIATSTSAGTEVTSTLPIFGAYSATISLGAEGSESAISQVKTFTVTIDQSMDPSKNKAIGSRVNQDLVAGDIFISGSFRLVFTAKTQYERFLGGTSQSTSTPTDTGIIFHATNGVSAGSGLRSFYLALRGGQYNTVGTPVEYNNVIEQTFSFTARRVYDFYNYDTISSHF